MRQRGRYGFCWRADCSSHQLVVLGALQPHAVQWQQQQGLQPSVQQHDLPPQVHLVPPSEQQQLVPELLQAAPVQQQQQLQQQALQRRQRFKDLNDFYPGINRSSEDLSQGLTVVTDRLAYNAACQQAAAEAVQDLAATAAAAAAGDGSEAGSDDEFHEAHGAADLCWLHAPVRRFYDLAFSCMGEDWHAVLKPYKLATRRQLPELLRWGDGEGHTGWLLGQDGRMQACGQPSLLPDWRRLCSAAFVW